MENVLFNGGINVRHISLIFILHLLRNLNVLNSAWWISDRPRPPATERSSSGFFYTKIRFDGTVPPPRNFIAGITTHPVWLALSADIFTGQIIASLIVLTFVAVFLLREWIAQNARPGVFEEEEALPPADPPPVQPPEPNPQLQRRVVEADFLEPDVLVQRQADAMRAVNAIRRQDVDPDVAMNPDRWFRDDDENPRRSIKKQKARKVDVDEGRHTDQGRKLDGDHVQEAEGFRRKQFHRRIRVAKVVGAHRRSFYRPQKPHFPPPLRRTAPVSQEGQQKFDFTFKSDQKGESPQLLLASSLPTSSPPTSSILPFTFNSTEDASPFPTVALQPPTSDIPFSLRSPPLQPEPSTSTQPYLARPPLPTNTLGGPGSQLESPFLYSPAKTPVDTPSLATYRVPEELGPIAGPSSAPPDYFQLEGVEQQVEGEAVYGEQLNDDDEWDNVDSDGDVDMDMEAENDKYFSEHGDVDIEVERERYLREVSRDESEKEGEPPQRERVVIESDSEDEGDEGDTEEIRDDGDHHADEEDVLRDVEEDEEDDEDDGPWQEDEDVEVVPEPQAGGEPAPAEGLDEEDPGPNLDPDDMVENVEDDMDGAMEGACNFPQSHLLSNASLLAIGMRGPVYAVFQNVCSTLVR